MADLAASGVTRKEAEVLAGLGEQLSNAEIAARLYVSERTVETHVSSLLRKLGASNRRELGRLSRSGLSPSMVGGSAVGLSGTVTFLFTDVEDSAALWDLYPAAMPAVMARHDVEVRQAIDRFGGRIFTTAGDGFGAAFPAAPEAVAAAVDAQRSLRTKSWPGNIAFAVRMGLHSGTATEWDGNYFGGVVNRAARIAATGRGGHILLSEATAGLVANEGWTTVDLGLHRLRGLERPERILRVDAPALPVVALPLRASRQRAGNLPHPSTRLVGRHAELRQAVDKVKAHRLVTIVGTGGAGKTRLALATADAVADQFPDGTWFVELGELHDAADIPSAVTTTLGLQPAPGASGAASTVAALAHHRALLLLDNCEHLIEGVTELVTAIESRCDRLTVLTTSREALGLGHEVRCNLHPLNTDAHHGTSDAAQLFIQRAAAVLGTFQPPDADIAIIDEICRRLDGLPLAIELATARVSTMSVAELSTRLHDRFRLLARRHGVNPRQQSLRATVAWSYDLLTDVEQAFFDQLSVFGSDFGPSAARAASGELAAPIDDLAMSLVDKSLLTTIRGPLGTRFRQLETLRQYGEARLAARGGTAPTRRRHLDHYVDWTETADAGIKGADELHWHQAFVAEWPNIRNAFRWACDVDDGDAANRLIRSTLWWANSRMRLEAEQWCDLILDLPSSTGHRLRPVAAAGAALFAHMRNDHGREQRALKIARADEERLGPASEPWVQVAVLNQWIGGPAAVLGDVAELRHRAESTTTPQIWRLRASVGEALFLATLIRGAAPAPDDEAGYIVRIREIVKEAETTGHPSSIADARASLGIALRSSEPTIALAMLEDALDLCEPLGIEETSNATRCELASHYTQLERPRDALTLMRTAIAEHVRIGAWHHLYSDLAFTASALASLQRPRVAANILGQLGTARPSQFNHRYHGFPALHEHLLAAIDATELTALLNERRADTLADLARIAIDASEELLDDDDRGVAVPPASGVVEPESAYHVGVPRSVGAQQQSL